MRKSRKAFIIACLAPALAVFLLLFLYPIIHTIFMSFFYVKDMSVPVSKWKYTGLSNYITLLRTYIFRLSLLNILKILIFGGIITMFFATLFAVILCSKNLRFRSFWRAIIYLPNIVSAVALATMWVQYVYNSNYGLFKSFFSALHLKALANIPWLSSGCLFISMLAAYCFGCIGYYMLILIAGMQRIPNDYYEYALLEGAGPFKRFSKITLPLIHDVYRTCFMFWSISAINFFTWSQLFTPNAENEATIVPVLYMYDILFANQDTGVTTINVGPGAALAVMLTILVLVVYGINNLLLPDKHIEY